MGIESDAYNSARSAFASGRTKSPTFRLAQLKALLRLYEENTPQLVDALAKDLRKSKTESIVTEISHLKNDVKTMIFNLSQWIKPTKAEKSLANMMDTAIIIPEPYGLVLIMSAWNYPVQLLFAPLSGAIAAGNCAILKPSEVAPVSAQLIADLVPRYLDNECYKVVLGGVVETTELLKNRFDYIFFTGSTQVGRIVNQAAAKFLTPITLELGGKSPVYLDDSVDCDIAVNRIMWGKCLNVGQSCIAPDYLICSSRSVRDKFVESVGKVVTKWYGDKIKDSPDYGRIINDGHFKRVVELFKDTKIAYGGDFDGKERYIQPTIVTDANPEDPIMREEIFGPILPILVIESPVEALNFINNREKPLVLYIFSNNKSTVDLLINNTSSGGVCVNDTMMHFSCDGLPFGGVGNSGVGAYHGRFSFDTFSHNKGVLIKNTKKFGEKMQGARYPPYNDSKLGFIEKMTTKRRGLGIPGVDLATVLAFGAGAIVTWFARCACHYLEQQKQSN